MKSFPESSGELMGLICDEIDKNPKVENFFSGVAPAIVGKATEYVTGSSNLGTVANSAVSGLSRSHKNTIAKIGGVAAGSAAIAVGSIAATPVLVGWMLFEIGKSIFSKD